MSIKFEVSELTLSIILIKMQRKKPSQLLTMTKIEENQARFGKQAPLANVDNRQKSISLAISQNYPMDDSPVSSPGRKKKTFITQKKASEVEIAHAQLNSYIDVLDTKVSKLIEKHQAEFLVAYRNHVKRVRQEMEQIRNKAMSNANSSVSQMQKIEMLQKQLTIFREESLSMFEKLNEKEKSIYFLTTKLKEVEVERDSLQNSVKELMKRNKILEGVKNNESRSVAFEKGETKQFQLHRPVENEDSSFTLFDTQYLGLKSRPYTTAINSKGASLRSRNHSIQLSIPKNYKMVQDEITAINSKIDELLPTTDQTVSSQLKFEIAEILKSVEAQSQQKQSIGDESIKFRNTRSFIETNKNSKTLVESKAQAMRSELEDYFYKSIETVRKEITRRRGLKSLNFYQEYSSLSLSQFKKVDFFRLLQLMLSHDRIIAALHAAIFKQVKAFS